MAPAPVFRPHFGPIGPPIPVDGIFNGTFTLKQLDDNGFLGMDGTAPSPNPRLQSHASGRLARLRTGAAHLNEMMPIHPCFVREKWDVMNLRQTAYDETVDVMSNFDGNYRDMTDAEWKAIEPAVREVSCFLDDPMVLEWFGGLLLGRWSALPQMAGKKDLGPIWSFDTLDEEYKRLNPGWEKKLWKKLATELPYMIRWSFGPSEFHGVTYPTDDQGWDANTSESIIILNRDYLDVLTGDVKATDWPHTLSQVDPDDPTKLHHYDLDAARIRTTHGLASTMLHELQHAVVYATFVDGRRHKINEPFFRDNRIAEQGFAFEQFAFRGVLDPIGPSSVAGVAAHPYGSEFSRFPGAMGAHEHKARGSLARWGVYGEFVYPVQMWQVCKFQDQGFWDTEMVRWGLDAVWYEQTAGFNVFLRLKAGQNLRWPGESPTIRFSSP